MGRTLPASTRSPWLAPPDRGSLPTCPTATGTLRPTKVSPTPLTGTRFRRAAWARSSPGDPTLPSPSP
jgi:hypothetical protein